MPRFHIKYWNACKNLTISKPETMMRKKLCVSTSAVSFHIRKTQLHTCPSVHHDLPQPTSLISFLFTEKFNIILNRISDRPKVSRRYTTSLSWYYIWSHNLGLHLHCQSGGSELRAHRFHIVPQGFWEKLLFQKLDLQGMVSHTYILGHSWNTKEVSLWLK